MEPLYFPKQMAVHSNLKKLLTVNVCTGSGRLLWLALLLLLHAGANAQDNDLLNKKITIERQRATIYDALNMLSSRAQCFFIYDSKQVESNKKVKVEADDQPLKDVLAALFPGMRFKIIGQHILIYKSAQVAKVETPAKTDSLKFIQLSGYIFDNDDKTPIAYATVGIPEFNFGTVTNTDGFFQLRVPVEHANAMLQVSYMGYAVKEFPVGLVGEQKVDVYLERKIISMQEVIIRYVDPVSVIRKFLETRDKNYNNFPVYLTNFYREGVLKNTKVLSYSEAVFRVYKSPVSAWFDAEQVKILKSRKVQNQNPHDTVYVKLKGGVQSALQLDVVKNIPDFLDRNQMDSYNYHYTDLVSINDRQAYAISFEQKEEKTEPLYKGVLYFDSEDFSLLSADFEVNPLYLQAALERFIVKKTSRINVKLEGIKYSVSYKLFDGRYYINHARCDISLKTKLRNRLFGDSFHTFMEMATFEALTKNVTRFEREETLKTNQVFTDIPYVYDATFWADYNTIAPEDKLNDALKRLIPKIEEMK